MPKQHTKVIGKNYIAKLKNKTIVKGDSLVFIAEDSVKIFRNKIKILN